MKYMLLIYGDQSLRAHWTQEQQQQEMQEYFAFNAEMQKRGVLRAGEALMGTEMATTVRVRDGKTLTTDGPFAETKETLGGYYVIEAKDLDEAIEIATKLPGVHIDSIEIRPLWDYNQGT
ncbi:MAG: YciI family protein [bacterium]|nr:YciI family protein [bacterium]